MLDAIMLDIGTPVAAVLVPVWMVPLCSLMVSESHLTGIGYAGLHMGQGHNCESGNAKEKHKPTKEKVINYSVNPPDTFHMCEESVPCSATLHQ